EVDGPRAGQRREEEAFAAEERVLEAADELDVVRDRGWERDDAAGVDADRLAGGEVAADDGPAGVDEGESVAREPLQDEALAAEEPRAQLAGEGDLDLDTVRGAEERVLLAEEGAAEPAQVEGDDLPRVRRGEGDVPLPRPGVEERRDEEALAGDHPLEALEDAAAGRGLQLDPRPHVHHGAGLGADALARIELDLDELHVVAVDGVIDHVGHGTPPEG